jgi:hypothetical protein
MFWLLLYLIVAALVARSFVRFTVASGEWDMTDVVDVGLVALLALIVAAIWPVSLFVGLLMALVHREADRG